jgi:hypothetical protein
MKIAFLPHTVEQMVARGISAEEARAALEDPDAEYPGRFGRTVAEKTFPGRRLATKVVYNRSERDEYIVVTAERGRRRRP